MVLICLLVSFKVNKVFKFIRWEEVVEVEVAAGSMRALPAASGVGDATVGDPLLMMRPDGSGAEVGEVTGVRPSGQPCLALVTLSGIRLTCSYSTPVPLRRGAGVDLLDARDCLVGDVVSGSGRPTVFAGSRWPP